MSSSKVENRGASSPRRAHGQLAEVELPLEARAAAVVLAAEGEGVFGPVGQRPELEQRVEAVALEHRAPVDPLVAEVVGTRVERLLPARPEQLIDLPAALGELAVGEDPLLADLHAADAAGEPRGAGDDVGHARASDATGRRRTALVGAASIGVEPEAQGRGTVEPRVAARVARARAPLSVHCPLG